MRKLVLKMSMSVDGFVGGPEGQTDWMFRSRDAGGAAWVTETLRGAGVHVMGSRTFEKMATYWPTSTDSMAGPMNDIPKVVFSKRASFDTRPAGKTTPAHESWIGARVAGGDLAQEIERMKAEGGNYILAQGGASFARSLIAANLVDEIRLVVHPVALGRGMALFADLPNPLHLSLISTTRFDSGTIANVYRPAR